MYKSGKFFNFKNKYWEFQTTKFEEWAYFDITLRFDRKCDHAGFRFHIEVFGLYLGLDIYDNRHWDEEKGDWA